MKIHGTNGSIRIPAFQNLSGIFGEVGWCYTLQRLVTNVEYGTVTYDCYTVNPTNINLEQIKRK